MDPASAMEIINRSHARREPDPLMDLMADDARMVVYDRAHPPGEPMVLEGKAAIRGHMDDVFSRDMTHEVTRQAVGGDTLAYHVACRYPTGEGVAATYIATLDGDGHIVELVGTQAWDE